MDKGYARFRRWEVGRFGLGIWMDGHVGSHIMSIGRTCFQLLCHFILSAV